ncbi:MAG: glucosaminidase domain-containing protein [Parabacteroides merdae]
MKVERWKQLPRCYFSTFQLSTFTFQLKNHLSTKKNEAKRIFFPPSLPRPKGGGSIRINPVVILAQAAVESGWGQSDLASEHHNYFGLTAYLAAPTSGGKAQASSWAPIPSVFRTYDSPGDSFMDYARLIRSVYPFAADVSDDPKAFARKDRHHSKYIRQKSTATTVPPIKRCWSRFAEKSVNSFPTPINHNS